MATLAIAALLCSQSAPPSFAEWAASSGAVYSPAERQLRAAFYAANLAKSSALDAADPLARFGPGPLFADRSPAELANLAGLVDCDGPVIPPDTELQAVFTDRKIAAALADPAGIDWVKRGAVTSAGDPNQPSTWVGQGRCGTCAQFSATGDIESQWFLAGNKLVDLAVQEMIDCSSYTGPYGMGWVSSVNHGIALASTYPLANHSDPNITGCRAPCNTKEAASKFAKIDGATCLPDGIHDNETQMIAWLQHGPLSVSIAAGALGPYHGGIISGASCNNTAVDHAVLLVGFGEDKGVPYWKLKNSWGPMFGEDGGYFRMVRGYDKTIPGFNCLGLRGACQAYIGKPPGADAIPSTRW